MSQQATYVRVRNVQNRTFNGVKFNQCVDTPNPDFYLSNGFVLVAQDGRNIVEDATDETQLTKGQAKELLDKAGVKYDKKANMTDLLELVKTNNLQIEATEPVKEDELKDLEDELNG